MIYEDFSDIAPYKDSEFKPKMAQLVKEPGFEHAIRYVMPDVDYPEFVKVLMAISTIDEFQKTIVAPFLEMLAMKTTSGITIGGLEENCDKNKSYTFITNHRDIVLDASFLNIRLLKYGFPIAEVAIGNNLLIYDWITDLVKLNGSFIVKRGLKMIKALEAAKHLSAYIDYAINKKNKSVWIAQREGRAKDSNDLTQEGIIKMLAFAGDGNMVENLLAINITPIAISYEYDPNDYLKAREFLMRKNDPEFKKSQRDDLFSMETGLLQFKGHVHFEVGKCINSELEKLKGISDKSEIIKCACAAIDRSIHSGYKLYPINYIAADKLNKSSQFAKYYTEQEVFDFENYISNQLAKCDLTDISEDDYSFMYDMMLVMYANPVKNKMAALA